MLRRAVKNPIKISGGKQSILRLLDSVDRRCNREMRTDLDADVVEFMDCKAKVYEGGDEEVSEGQYNSSNCTHAEMNALVAYIAQETDFATIDKIEITSPPCKSCAFVLELLGVIDKIKTTAGIYKHATGSWRWPSELQNSGTFDAQRWREIQAFFANSGLTEQEILEAVIGVVQRRSAL